MKTYQLNKTYQSNCFILQTTDNHLWYFFYSNYNSICYSLYSNKHWSNPVTVTKDVNYNFSVNLTDEDNIYVFCQDKLGNVVLCLYENEKWTSKIILENKADEIHDINFQMLFSSQSLNLMYSMPISGEKNAQLIYHSKDKNKWASPQILDTIIPFTYTPFTLQKISDTHSIAFYEKRGNDCALGYREFSSTLKKWGNFNPFHSTSYTYIDQSFLTTEDTIHVLYIVKTSFSYQLIYKYKNGSEWSSQLVIYECNKIDICSLFILDNQLWIIWYINSQLYTCISQNLGKTFSKPSRYQGHYISAPMKASFISNLKQKEEKLYLREILLYDQPIPELLLIPELYPDFYEVNSNIPIELTHKNEINYNTTTEPMITDTSLVERIDILKNKNLSCEHQLAEKNSQITTLIKEKNILSKTKEILENQIAQQGLEILSLQKQLEDKSVEEIESEQFINEEG